MDCFISYSHKDSNFAQQIHSSLMELGVSTFLAEISLKCGDNWTESVWSNLRESDFVMFLASKESCNSQFVLQELGGARYADKKIIPVVWDMSPSNLPGWVNQSHALDLRGKDPADVTEQFIKIIAEVKAGKWDPHQIIIAVVALVALAILVSRATDREKSDVSDPVVCPNCSHGSSQ